MAKDIQSRVRAQAVELLKKDKLNGHTYALLHPIVQGVSVSLKQPYAEVQTILEGLGGGVVVSGKRIMLEELVEAENMIASRVNALLERGDQ